MNEIERSLSSAESQNEPKTSNQRRAGVIVAAGCIGVVSFGLLIGGLMSRSSELAKGLSKCVVGPGSGHYGRPAGSPDDARELHHLRPRPSRAIRLERHCRSIRLRTDKQRQTPFGDPDGSTKAG